MCHKTEKLYYINAYTDSFTARTLSVLPVEGGYEVILDKTAFFPEEGGQASDTGFIGDCRVTYVYEKDGIIHHITDKEPIFGENLCKIDFADRFEKMQCHTAEHILCGIIHSLFGLDNVGFHLGADEVTFDVNGILDREQLDRVEDIANRAICSNLKVNASFPSAEELSALEYRAKLDITEGVRIVTVDGVDSCACCAPHVSATGEIGVIKILDFMKHRGGTRIWMVAGYRALRDYRARYESVKKISGMLSTPQAEIVPTLCSYMSESEEQKALLKAARLKIAELRATAVVESKGNEVFLLEDFSIPELIAFSNIANKKISGITVALSGSEGDYKYVISSNGIDLRTISRDINSALAGRGGGRTEMLQGSFSSALTDIEAYFKK